MRLSKTRVRKGNLRYYRCDPDEISINGMEETQESYQEALVALQNERIAVQE
jgi:hypothetical protein